MKNRRNVAIGAAVVVLIGTLGLVQHWLERTVDAQAHSGTTVMVPRYEVDPTFPKPLPNHWYQGMTIGVSVDAQDHVWIIHRPDSLSPSELAGDLKTGICCSKAPPVIEFDQQGNVLRHWGGPGLGYDWPNSNHGLMIDFKGNVWLGGNGGGNANNGGKTDGQILKFTQDGKFITAFGRKADTDSNDLTHFNGVATMSFDPSTNEAYVADGYFNRRVAVIDVDSGKIKRYWGAYGNKPDDTDIGRYVPEAPLSQQFRNPVHCAAFSSVAKMVYVCDRVNDRIQVFTADGKFVKEKSVMPKTLGTGSTWEIAFSRDPQQKYMFLTDGANMKVWILDRESLEVLSSFGSGGRQPGQFYAVHSIAMDSHNNIYTTETFDGRRLQRFIYKGMQAVQKGTDQGTVWPSSRSTK
jgi:DNA-binding beta-propeller fold protein YncE